MNNIGKFAVRGSVFAVAALLAGSTAMFAGTIPYSPIGTIASTTNLYASGTSVTAYYGGSNAFDTDYIDILDVTKGTSTGNVFDNQSTTEGSSVSLTTSVGDVIVIDVINTNGYTAPYQPVTFSSDPADSADGQNHAYITSMTNAQVSTPFVDPSVNGTTFLNFTSGEIAAIEAAGNPFFVGMEDEYYPTLQGTSTDLDYNDDTSVIVGVDTGVTPEPSSLMLLGTGLVGAAGLLFRRRQTV